MSTKNWKIVWNSVFFKNWMEQCFLSLYFQTQIPQYQAADTLKKADIMGFRRWAISRTLRESQCNLGNQGSRKSCITEICFLTWLNSVFPNPTDAGSHFFLLHIHEALGRSWNEKRKILGDVAKGNWGKAGMLCSVQHVLTAQILGLSIEVKYSWLIIPERHKKGN